MLGLSTALRNARNDAVTALAGASALLRVYSGTRPATGASIGAAVLLAQLTMNATFAAASSTGVLTCNAITSQLSAAATGTGTWFRIMKADGVTHVMDGSVSTVSDGTGDMQLDSTSIVSGGQVAMSLARFTDGNP